jgi:hypothetical protein
LSKQTLLFIVAAVVLLYFLLRPKTAAAAPAAGPQVTSTIEGFQLTQLGAPQAAIETLSYQQMTTDVQYWIDPASGMLIPNTSNLLSGGQSLVALDDQTQLTNWYVNNPVAVADMDAAGAGPLIPTAA